VKPAGPGAERNEQGFGDPFPVELQGDHIKGALYRLLYLTARQIQFGKYQVYFLPVERHGFILTGRPV
jgi:hypothetical protein